MLAYGLKKTLGFETRHLLGLIAGESLAISLTGGLIGIALSLPISTKIGDAIPSYFLLFELQPGTVILAGVFSLSVGLAAAIIPVLRAMHTSIVDG